MFLVSFFFIFLSFNFNVYSENRLNYKKKPGKFLKKEELAVKHLINKFINKVLSQDYDALLNLTSGTEKKFYQEFVKKYKAIKGYKKRKNNPIYKYLENFKKFKIFFIYVDLELNKSVVYCDFEFNYKDDLKRQISKVRRVHYFLKKEKKNWKIGLSKLKGEYLSYKDEKGVYWIH